MTPIEVKNIKKGETFYEKGPWSWIKLKALEDGHLKGTVDIMNKTYKQYVLKAQSKSGQEFNILVTEGLTHYNAKFFKKDAPEYSLPQEWVEENL